MNFVKIYKKRKGISMLIAIGLMSAIMYFALIISNTVVSSIRQSVMQFKSDQAYYAAEGALEDALVENNKYTAGYTVRKSDIYLDCTPLEPNCARAQYSIQGSVPDDRKYDGGYFDGMYGIPTPGTGDVGADCDPLKAPYESAMTYWYSATDEPNYVYAASDPSGDYIQLDDAADHPCNWNKIGVGDVVSIPLYTTDSYGVVSNPEDLGISSLMIRLRTACDGGDEMCLKSERLALDDTFGDVFYACDLIDTFSNCGDTVVSWEIKGESIDGKNMYVLGARRDVDVNNGQRKSWNSELYEFKLNRVRTILVGSCSNFFCMLNQQDAGEDLNGNIGLIGDFLLNTIAFVRTGDDKINKPVLKLSVIHSLRDKYNAPDLVPFLEYQILMDAATAPADSSQTITAEGMSGTFKFTVEAKVPQEGAVLDYVIQQ